MPNYFFILSPQTHIFTAPPNVTKDLPPVVSDGMGNENPQSDIGLFPSRSGDYLGPGPQASSATVNLLRI